MSEAKMAEVVLFVMQNNFEENDSGLWQFKDKYMIKEYR